MQRRNGRIILYDLYIEKDIAFQLYFKMAQLPWAIYIYELRVATIILMQNALVTDDGTVN